MTYLIFDGDAIVNHIVADEDFVKAYCAENGYTYTLVEKPEEMNRPKELTSEERMAILEAENKEMRLQLAQADDALIELYEMMGG